MDEPGEHLSSPADKGREAFFRGLERQGLVADLVVPIEIVARDGDGLLQGQGVVHAARDVNGQAQQVRWNHLELDVHGVVGAGDVLEESQAVHVHAHLKPELDGHGLPPLVKVEGLEIEFNAAQHAGALGGGAEDLVAVLDLVVPLPRHRAANGNVDLVFAVRPQGEGNSVIAGFRHHPTWQHHGDLQVGAAELLGNNGVQHIVRRVQRGGKARLHDAPQIVVLDGGEEIVDRRVIDVGRQKVEEAEVDRFADRPQHHGVIVAHRRGTRQAVMLVHTGDAGFGAPFTVGVVETARRTCHAFGHGVADPCQFAHRQVDAGDAVGHARDDVVHREGVGEEVQVHQTVVMRQTKPIGREQRHIGKLAELNDLDAPFFEQIGLKIMQAGPQVENGVSLVRKVQRDVKGESWVALSDGHHRGFRGVPEAHGQGGGLRDARVSCPSLRVVHRPLAGEMIPHHDAGAVGVHRADVSEGRGFDQEGRAVAGLRENGEIRADFAAHHKETLVGPFHVQFGASGEVEFRHVKGHGGLGAETNRGLEHVVGT